MAEEYYLTPERLKELKKELEELKTAKRAEISERLKRAKELGDLSENSEYLEAREAQEQLEQKIYELENILRNAVLIKRKSKSKKIEIGSSVVVEKGGKKMEFTIVGANEARPEKGFISNESPLGRSFLGRSAREKIKVMTPAGEVIYKILSIK